MTTSEGVSENAEEPLIHQDVFKLKVKPEQIIFAGNLFQEVRTRITLRNRSGTRQAFKIRCSSNKAFKICPPIGIVNDRPVDVDLIYRGDMNMQPDTRHHFTIYHIPAPHGATAEGAWEEHYGPAQGKRSYVVEFSHQ